MKLKQMNIAKERPLKDLKDMVAEATQVEQMENTHNKNLNDLWESIEQDNICHWYPGNGGKSRITKEMTAISKFDENYKCTKTGR